MNTVMIELLGLATILVLCGVIYLVAGPAALAAVAGVASALFATWRGARNERGRGRR
ncbi:hypothetical protein Ais01nite_58150 [Asanoa ishikariensis]|uniref:Uncharacterized protein n=1 Tax=Asanoa ishikariensis TaxID=137265 RepID=A0A1H3UZS0_9ACTN|nr:hypothetical protein [Asanoa ishikariensis]GIF67780.1 hypothetical protein Ais01nite_58150 [Asanoa ishikariensis]SDZ67943.1 hypothetical protein SAMN05421684_0001 [Asanoa ishikariensis]